MKKSVFVVLLLIMPLVSAQPVGNEALLTEVFSAGSSMASLFGFDGGVTLTQAVIHLALFIWFYFMLFNLVRMISPRIVVPLVALIIGLVVNIAVSYFGAYAYLTELLLRIPEINSTIAEWAIFGFVFSLLIIFIAFYITMILFRKLREHEGIAEVRQEASLSTFENTLQPSSTVA